MACWLLALQNAERVQAHVLDAIEQAVSRALQGQPLDDDRRDDQEEN